MSGSPTKRALRDRLKRALSAMTPAQRDGWSARVCERVVESDEFQEAPSVLAFWALASEPDVSGVVDAALASGKTLALPSASWGDGGMVARRWDGDRSRLVETRFGIFEPTRECETIEEVGLVVVPGLGFDESGGRLGRGGGFYDRFLSGLREGASTIGVAFEAQIVERIPIEPHDVRVRAIATERRLIRARDTEDAP